MTTSLRLCWTATQLELLELLEVLRTSDPGRRLLAKHRGVTPNSHTQAAVMQEWADPQADCHIQLCNMLQIRQERQHKVVGPLDSQPHACRLLVEPATMQ